MALGIAASVRARIQRFVISRRVRYFFVGHCAFAFLLGEAIDYACNETLGLSRISEAAEVLLDAAGEGRTRSDAVIASFLFDLDPRRSR